MGSMKKCTLYFVDDNMPPYIIASSGDAFELDYAAFIERYALKGQRINAIEFAIDDCIVGSILF